MAKLAKIAQRKRNQVAIDRMQDLTNQRQDQTDERHTLVNFYQSLVLTIYGVLLLGLFVMSVIGYFLK